MSDVREVASTDFVAIGRALALAFEDDPVMAYLFPDAATRLRRLRSLYRAVLPLIASQGLVLADEGLHAAAVWQAPSPRRPGRLAAARVALRLLLSLRGAATRANVLNETILPAHLREPHWYLAILGTEPSHQGRGLGRGALLPVLERCDREDTLAYLESSKAENVPFYERHGFEVTEELRVREGPTLWAMLRRPRAAG